MMRNSKLDITLWQLVILVLCGCSNSPPQNTGDVSSPAAAYGEGLDLFGKKNYSLAKDKLLEATNAKTLRSDLQEEALVKLALSQAMTGEANTGVVVLAEVEKQPFIENPGQFYIAKSFVLGKSGDRAGATTAMGQARRVNPRIRPFVP